ncbi:MAG: ABC transporter ATP-binding protein [Vulcanimicrobiota bacterium]
MNLRLEEVEWGVDGRTIVDRVSLAVEAGQLVGLLGPNGSGKSSLLRTVYRVNQPRAGQVWLDEHQVWKESPRWLAQRAATVLQENLTSFDYTVAEMVAMGRIPHQTQLGGESQADREAVTQALAAVGLPDFGERVLGTLSGGEKQRVLVARALAQEPRFLVLDEPTNHLDVRHCLELLDLLTRLRVGVLLTLHDLNLAAQYCHRLVMLKAGRVVAEGTPDEVFRPDLLAEVYEVEAEVARHPRTGKLQVTFFSAQT